MNFHLKDLKGAIFEDDAPKKAAHIDAVPVAVASPVQQPVSSYVTYVALQASNEVADPQDDAYQRLVAKTDWTKLPVFLAIQKYLAPMASLAVDDKTKFTIALKQAQAQENIDPAAVSQSFENMKTELQNAATAFAQIVATKTASDVDMKKKQAEDLQAKVAQLTEEAFNAKQRLDTAQHKFDVAAQTRLNEINQEQTKYASLLA